MFLKEIELASHSVTLIPLRREHACALVEAASDGNLWELWFTSVPSSATIDDYISTALEQQEKGIALPFVIVAKHSGKIIGSTRFCNADPVNRRLEIGYTWYSKSDQRSSINSECKLMLLQHAFEALDVIAVEFRTHWHNQQSRAAIARLGAKQDGILRNHQKMPDGAYRDTVVFSIINIEWAAVKKNLIFKMNKY
ncbi:GNAT family N-acetyltransferase [Psychromonas sp. SR45-3]|uniref:GNAT family N-acetyltransferase n=1 Tax=Psychromonas sp. SR45-3 TaxID=2760930 RepID=UPI0015FB3593|nr:GNAT family protein [Psychromonas sp. SR45-3]MBB1274547.1 GNAT family N-acetyltransferase [Psychromonas sp. SR45-3]